VRDGVSVRKFQGDATSMKKFDLLTIVPALSASISEMADQ
jgi:hypothetical protein